MNKLLIIGAIVLVINSCGYRCEYYNDVNIVIDCGGELTK